MRRAFIRPIWPFGYLLPSSQLLFRRRRPYWPEPTDRSRMIALTLIGVKPKSMLVHSPTSGFGVLTIRHRQGIFNRAVDPDRLFATSLGTRPL
jgi:hypothetical protein